MNTTLRAQDLDGLLDRLPESTRVLSLDCFDTLLWRKVALPADVFFSLQSSAPYLDNGLTAEMRVNAEIHARRKRKVLADSFEVTLADIYRELLPQADAHLIEQVVSVELSAECAHGFIYEPVARLIHRAHARGLRVIVVSDTYLSSKQLRQLLARLMGDEAMQIQQVYCSSDAGKSKTTGIWPEILRQEKCLPQQMFHLGDNPVADQACPAKHGVPSAWLQNHKEEVASLLVNRNNIALQLMPELRHTHALPSLHHAQLASHGDEMQGAAEHIGYRSLGPVLCNFARFVSQEVHALQTQNKPVKVAFLLRDGYLPARACEPFLGKDLPRLNISRFTAIAASLQTREDVVQLLSSTLSKKSMPALLRQLLVPEAQAQRIMRQVGRSPRAEMEFARLVLSNPVLNVVLQQARDYRQRLISHVRQRTGVVAGDTLVLVDLGYSGTVQNRLRQVFQEELGVDLFGLYLINKHNAVEQTNRKGLIDGRDVDARLIDTLTAYIGLFEMMCTNDEASTVDYTSAGDPVYTAKGASGPQDAVVKTIQASCLRFIHDAHAIAPGHRPKLHNSRELTQQTVADIGRLMYLPSAAEIECLGAFEFEFNLGTDLLLPTVDLKASETEYRREGFAMMNRDFNAQRIGYPLEMRNMDVSLSTTLLSQLRFGYGNKPSEASLRHEVVPTLIANPTQHLLGSEKAWGTSDGFFRLHLPMSAGFDLSLLLGQRYEWLQLDSIQKVPLNKKEPGEDLALGEAVFLDGLAQVEGTLIKLTPDGMMYFPACSSTEHGKFMIRVVFRPVVERTELASVPLRPSHETVAPDSPPLATPIPIEEPV